MKKDFIIGGLLAFLFATSSCTTTHNEGAAAVELFPPPLMGMELLEYISCKYQRGFDKKTG